MKYVITTDTTCDMSQRYFDENNVGVLALSYTIDGITYAGEGENQLSPAEFYQKLRNGSMPQTAQVNPEQAKKDVCKLFGAGYQCPSSLFSSALSGSYQSTVIAADDLNGMYGDAKVVTIDSRCASMGEGLLLYYAVELKKRERALTRWPNG